MLTRIISEFVVNASYDTLPGPAIVAAKRGVTDLLAVSLAGSCEPAPEILKQLAAVTTQQEEATIINGAGLKTTAPGAAYINGTMAHALDYDDVIHVGPLWMGHPSVAILPAVLAIAEKSNASGKQVLLAYCVGMEVYAKVGLLVGDKPYKEGWHNTSFIGTMAAVAGVAKVLNLNEQQLRRAFGIAASLAGGLRQNFGTMTKPLHAGIAARNGVEAVLLAAAGFTADENIFEAPLGFRNVFTAGRADISQEIPQGNATMSPAQFAASLGEPWTIYSPGAAFKICPSCRATHFGMEAALNFRQRAADPLQIEEVECHVPNHMESVLFYHNPAAGLEGKFSLEYVLARTLLDGVPKIGDFTDERVNEPKIKQLISKIRWNSFEPAAGTFGAPEFIIKLKDGTRFHSQVEFPRGEPENPVSAEVLVDKFRDCAGTVLSRKAVDEIERLISDLEHLENVSQLTDLLGNCKQ